MEFGLFAIPGVGEALVAVTTGCPTRRHSHDGYSIGIFDQPVEIWSRGALHQVNPGMVIALEPGEAHGGEGTAQNVRQHGLFIYSQFMEGEFGSLQPFTLPQAVFSDRQLSERLLVAISTRAADRLKSCLHDLFARHARRVADERVGGPIVQTLDPRLNRFQRYRLCRSTTGLSPSELGRITKVEAARSLIRKGLPLAEVALIAGFADQAHMTRQMREMWGITPGTFRRNTAA